MQSSSSILDSPAPVPTNPYEACSKLAREHYENFPVGRLVPKKLRPHVHAVYAFARVADDLADEGYADPRAHSKGLAPSEAERLAVFRNYRQAWQNAIDGKQYDLEIHIVHELVDGPKGWKEYKETLAVVGVLFKVADYSHPFIEKLRPLDFGLIEEISFADMFDTLALPKVRGIKEKLSDKRQ